MATVAIRYLLLPYIHYSSLQPHFRNPTRILQQFILWHLTTAAVVTWDRTEQHQESSNITTDCWLPRIYYYHLTSAPRSDKTISTLLLPYIFYQVPRNPFEHYYKNRPILLLPYIYYYHLTSARSFDKIISESLLRYICCQVPTRSSQHYYN